MKKVVSLDVAKEQVNSLLGKNVVVKLNRGRNKVKNYRGVLSEVHSNVFVVQVKDDFTDRISCSYADMLCGEVHLFEHFDNN